MNKILIVVRRDISETLRTKTIYFFMILACVLSLPYFGSFSSVIDELLEQGMPTGELQLAIQQLLNIVLETLPWVLSMITCSVFSAHSIAMDKAKRTLESLLATPLSLRQIWLGKSLAVTLPGVAIGLLISLLTMLAMNLAVVVPTVGSFIMPNALSIMTGLVIIPLLTFLVVSLVSFLQLIMADPRIANFVFIGAFLIVYISTITELFPSQKLVFGYVIAIGILAALTAFLARFLTRERVILSSKG